MPRLRNPGAKQLRTDFEDLNEAQRHQLEDGTCFLFMRDKGYQSAEELQIGWELHGKTLLDEFIAQRPGTRPFGWWMCTHKLERPIVNHHGDDDEAIDRNYRAQTFGFLHTSIWLGQDDAGKMLDWQEPEHVYLRRHNLLTTAELAHPDLESESI